MSDLATAGFDPIAWNGHWIGPELIVDPLDPDPTREFQTETRPFSRVFFRREIALTEAPAAAPLRLTADSRYVLWVNGSEVGRGPIRSQPRRWQYDEYDIAPYLVEGVNTVAVLVTYYGRANSFWQPAVGAGGVGCDAILVVEGRLGERELVSDAQWRVLRAGAWTTPSATGDVTDDSVPVEILDARALPEGWLAAGFDDSGWSPAAVLAAVHAGSLARTRPPTNPYGRLIPRSIAMQGGDLAIAENFTTALVMPRPEWGFHPADRVLTVIRATTLGAAIEHLPTRAHITSDQVLVVGADFGRIVAGFVEVDIEAPAGTVVELLYRERVYDAGRETWTDPRTAARYTVAGEGGTYAAVELNGLRYVYAVVHSDVGADVAITRVAVREHVYPQVGNAFFRSSDPELDRLYRVGVRTVQLNAFDSFTDCPTREQRAWVGDGVVHQMVHLTSNEDWDLARRYVELGDSPRADGMLPMSVVGDLEFSGTYTIPDWALHWVHGVYNLYRYTGDRRRVLSHLPSVERVLRWYEPYVDEHGTLANVTEWNLIDWSSVFVSGRSSIITALWARGLRELAEMGDWIGNAGSASWARDRYAAAAAGFEDFWCPDRGLYVDHILDGVPQPAVSQAGNATAIVSGLASEGRWNGIIEKMTDPQLVVVASWIGDYEVGGYSAARSAEELKGNLTPTWDIEQQIVRAEPFYSYLVHDAIAAGGRTEILVRVLRDWTGLISDGYDTFDECWGWGTPVHGWSSTPTKDLVTHVLGVTPNEPGFASVRIAPRPGDIDMLEGAVPTPHGLVHVAVRNNSDVNVTSPVEVVLVAVDGTETHLPAGTHQVRI